MLAKLSGLIVALIAAGGYPIVTLLMAIESACIPLPSEVIMPFAGYTLAHSTLRLLLVATVGAIGCNLGSIPPYLVGAKGGRPMVNRYGHFLLLSMKDVDHVERLFHKYGGITVLIGRLLPVVRTFIALPAGVAKMNQVRFHLYTFVGSWPWCFFLAYIGMKLGNAWDSNPKFKSIFHRFQLSVEIALVALFIWFVISHWKNRHHGQAAELTD